MIAPFNAKTRTDARSRQKVAMLPLIANEIFADISARLIVRCRHVTRLKNDVSDMRACDLRSLVTLRKHSCVIRFRNSSGP
jgi:hypothetical protein